MPKLGEAFVVIRAALGPLKSGLAAARSAVGKAMSTITSTVKKAMSLTYKWIKRAFVAISAAVMGSVYAFSKFEEQMANVSTMLDDHTMNFMPRYSKAIRQMSVDFGEGTASLSKGLYDILSASIAPAKALDVLAVAAKTARAGMTTTAVAADVLTTMLNAYGLSADKVGRVSDILFAIIKKGKTTFAELAPSIGKIAGVSAIAGLSMEQLGAAMATMTRVLPTEIAATSARAIVMGFLKPMESAKAAAQKFGFELSSATLKAIGLTGVLQKLKGATGEQLAEMFPNVRGLAGLAVALKKMETNLEDYHLMLNSAGLTQKAYEKMTGTLAHTLRRLKQSFIILATSIGSTLAPAFDFLTKITISSTEKAIEYLEKHKFAIMKWAVVVAARINFVRGVMQDFIVGAYKNWPETWKFMKDVAVGQIDVIWKSFNLGLSATLEIAINMFVAFGKSLGHIFGKIWSEFENRAMVAGQRSLAKKIEYEREYSKELKKLAKGTTGGGTLGRVIAPEAAKRYAAEKAREKVALAEKQGIFDVAFPTIPTDTWATVGKSVIKEFVPALAKAKAKLAEVQEKMVEIQKASSKGIKVPAYIKNLMSERRAEMRKLEKELLDQIDRMENAAKEATGAVGLPTGGVGGGAGGPMAAAGSGKVGFVGLRDAWGALAQSINKDRTQENILKEAQLTNKKLDTVNDNLDNFDLGVVT